MEKLITWLNEERGRRFKLSEYLKMTPGALSQWDRVPVDRVAAVATYTGIPREELRPDIFTEVTS